MKRFLKIVSSCLVSLIIVLLLINIVINFFSKDGVSNKFFNYRFYDVVGDSMDPKIKDGDFIAVDIKKKDKYEVGDIISFKEEVSNEVVIVTHKIIRISDSYDGYEYLTWGVNNDEGNTEIVLSDEVIGEYKGFRIPLLGYVVRFSRTTIGYFTLVVLPLGLMLFGVSYELIKEISKKKEEK